MIGLEYGFAGGRAQTGGTRLACVSGVLGRHLAPQAAPSRGPGGVASHLHRSSLVFLPTRTTVRRRVGRPSAPAGEEGRWERRRGLRPLPGGREYCLKLSDLKFLYEVLSLLSLELWTIF